jgi:hypothetical protein
VVAEPAPPIPANSVSVHLRYAYRVGNEGDTLVPAVGLSLGGEFERRYAAFLSGIELGAAVDFFYDRFSKDVIASSPGPTGQEASIVTRTLSQTSFALLQTAAWRYADMRVFAAVGGGISIGYFGSVDLASSGTTTTQPIARGVLGFDFAIAKLMAAILRVDYSHGFDQGSFAAAGTSYRLFGDIFSAGIGLLVRF